MSQRLKHAVPLAISIALVAFVYSELVLNFNLHWFTVADGVFGKFGLPEKFQLVLPATRSHRSGRVNNLRLCRRRLGALASDSAYDHENSASVFAAWHHLGLRHGSKVMFDRANAASTPRSASQVCVGGAYFTSVG